MVSNLLSEVHRTQGWTLTQNNQVKGSRTEDFPRTQANQWPHLVSNNLLACPLTVISFFPPCWQVPCWHSPFLIRNYRPFVRSRGISKADIMVYGVENCPVYHSMPTNISSLHFSSSQLGQPQPSLDTIDARYDNRRWLRKTKLISQFALQYWERILTGI